MTKANKLTWQRAVFNVFIYAFLLLMTLSVLLPFFVMLIISLTPSKEFLATMDFIWFPKQGLDISSYKTAFSGEILSLYGINVFTSFWNTIWQTVPTLLVSLFVSGAAGFAYAKLNFPGKNFLFAITLGTMMFPGAVLTMPSYIYYNALGWANSVLPLIIPGLFGSAMTVFFLRQFFMTIPTELIEAGKMDGMGYMKMYTHIMIPLAKPAFIAQGIFAFVGGYNNYMGPLLYLNGKIELYPLQMSLTLFRSVYAHDVPVVCAYLVLALIPLLLFYIFFQKFFREGIASTGVKE